MPAPFHPWVPLALGSAAARGAGALWKAADTRYIRDRPLPPKTSVSTAMAKRTSSRTMIRKRSKRRRRGFRRPSRALSFMWPSQQLVKFKVIAAINYTVADGAAASATTVYNLKANSLNDPTGSLSGNLPLGLDQWAAMYSRYAVVSSTTYVKIHNASSTGSVTFGLTLRKPNESDDLTNAGYYQEVPMTRSKILSPDLDHAGLGLTYKAKKYWRFRKFKESEDLHGDFDTSPGDPAKFAYFQFWTQDTAGSNGYTVEGWLTMEFVCLLFDPRTPSRSAL